MSLENIKVQNFKSFKNLDVSLDEFNVIIGANASGKSNFAQAFSFLRDIVTHGLDSAISLQGGLKYLRSFASPDAPVTYEITFNINALSPLFPIRRTRSLVLITGAVYRFEIKPESDSEFDITTDEWTLSFAPYTKPDSPKSFSGDIVLSNNHDVLKAEITLSQNDYAPNTLATMQKHANEFCSDIRLKPRSLSLENPVIFDYILSGIGDFCAKLEIYDFDPKLVKSPVSIKGMAELESDGSNLAIVLKDVMADRKNSQQFSNLMENILPFVSFVGTETLLDRSIMLTQKEHYFPEQSIPATLVSDGTINVTALITALYFQANPLMIIEEPERNVHPSLASRIADMLKDASSNKRIIVTTHSTELIRHVDIKNILLIRRDKMGYSEVTRPTDHDDIKVFLKNEMDIGELYVQNMLDV